MTNREMRPTGMSRRQFLRKGAVAGAGLAVAPSILHAAAAAGDEIRVAIIGAGTQGRVLIEQAIKIPGVRFKAVCDIWPYSQKYSSRRLKAYDHETNVYEDYREMLAREKDLDAAIVATPDWMHAEHAIACMKAGLDVYCEKEMSNDLAEARAMVDAARETGKLLQIGHQRRSNPRYLHAREKLLEEAALLGRITHIYGQWNRGTAASGPRGCPRGQEMQPDLLAKYGYENMRQFRDWRWFKKYGGGPIVDLGSHQIDIFGWFLGDAMPASVQASGGVDYYTDVEWYDNVLAIYTFETDQGPVRAFYQTLTTSSARGYYETFMGDEGTLQISEDPRKCRVYAEGHLPLTDTGTHPWATWVDKGYLLRYEPPAEASATTDQDAIIAVYKSMPPAEFLMKIDVETSYHQPHLANFFDTMRGKAELNCPAQVGYETAVQVLKVNEAVEARRTLDFAEGDFKA